MVITRVLTFAKRRKWSSPALANLRKWSSPAFAKRRKWSSLDLAKRRRCEGSLLAKRSKCPSLLAKRSKWSSPLLDYKYCTGYAYIIAAHLRAAALIMETQPFLSLIVYKLRFLCTREDRKNQVRLLTQTGS